MVRLGTMIRERRREMGLTQRDLADDVGVSNGYIARIEIGGRSPGAKILFKISEVLQIPSAELISLSIVDAKYAPMKFANEIDKKICSLPLKVKVALLEFAPTIEKML